MTRKFTDEEQERGRETPVLKSEVNLAELRQLFLPRLKELQTRAAQGDKFTHEDYGQLLHEACLWWANATGQPVLTSTMLKMIKGEVS